MYSIFVNIVFFACENMGKSCTRRLISVVLLVGTNRVMLSVMSSPVRYPFWPNGASVIEFSLRAAE